MSKAKPKVRAIDAGDWREETLARMRTLILEADPGMIEERKWRKPSNRMAGIPVGVVANQPQDKAGTIDSPACEKISPFITTCDAFGLPLIFLIDTPGFFVGLEAEKTGLARRVGNILHTLGHATVPRFNVVLRKAYGLAYVAMGGGRSAVSTESASRV